jgi:hypothetical protein
MKPQKFISTPQVNTIIQAEHDISGNNADLEVQILHKPISGNFRN